MSKVFYVTEGAKVKCTMGLMNPKELKGTSHGVFRMNGNTALPVLNGMDNVPENIDVPGGSYNIPSFCKCKSLANIDIPRDHPELAANPALITEIEANAETVGTCKCRPLFPAPWINGATQTITGDFVTLTSDCMIVCAKGFGVVSIVEEAGFSNQNLNINDRLEFEGQCCSQVEYGSTDLSKEAIQYRIDNNIVGARNVAVYEYEIDGEKNVIVGASQRNQGHAERLIAKVLENLGIQPVQVTRIYSELEPCLIPGGYCKRFIHSVYPQAEVTYSFEYGISQESRRTGVKELKKAVEKVFES